MRKQREKVDETTKCIDENTKELTKLRVDLKSARKAIERSGAQAVKLEAEVVATKEKLERLREATGQLQ